MNIIVGFIQVLRGQYIGTQIVEYTLNYESHQKFIILGMVQTLGGGIKLWSCSKGTDKVKVSTELLKIIKTVSEKSISNNTSFDYELELYFDKKSGL